MPLRGRRPLPLLHPNTEGRPPKVRVPAKRAAIDIGRRTVLLPKGCRESPDSVPVPLRDTERKIRVWIHSGSHQSTSPYDSDLSVSSYCLSFRRAQVRHDCLWVHSHLTTSGV